MHGHLSEKADVFSFGVLVLELISGQRNSTFNLNVDAQSLLDWVRSYINTLFIKNPVAGAAKKKTWFLCFLYHSYNGASSFHALERKAQSTSHIIHNFAEHFQTEKHKSIVLKLFAPPYGSNYWSPICCA